MSLGPGTRLGPYEIAAPIGAGGMGEVYKAKDIRLDRTVAVKVLPSHVSSDPPLRERFDREARTIAALNHPHICTLYDVGHEADTDFLVLEYLEGQTLADRLTKGALPLDQALHVAIQIADALDKAHRAGIVHRDLKPANVFLVRTGGASAPPVAKLLDFGLAKSTSPVVATSGLSMLPTTPPNLTAQGAILGTFQYMAPEQIEGLEADARTDIFAFGALLFEMLSGRTAFEGKTRAGLLAAILKDEPPAVSRVQPAAPASLDRIISTCLAKDPDDRYQSSRDLLRDLKWVASGAADGVGARTAAPPARSNRLAWLVAVVATIALIATTVVALRPTGALTSEGGPVQFTIAAPENTAFGGPLAGGTGIATQVAVSPDGRNIVFVAGARDAFQIWLRPIADPAARPIPGTDGGSFPFWSPDSLFIGFFADGKLKKVSIAGGPPSVLCDAPSGRGGSWNRDNVILFTPSAAGGGLQRVSSAGGVPTVVTTPDVATAATGTTNHRWPHFLPDGRHFLYTEVTGPWIVGHPASKPAAIRIGSLDPADTTITLLQAESSALYASGHVLFARDETLMAQPFDIDAHQPNGDPFPIAEHVSREGSRYVGASVSENGTLVYAAGGSQEPTQLTWFDRTGRVLSTLGEAARYIDLALSPDEHRVAASLGSGSPENTDIWIIDIARNVRSRLTSDPGNDVAPVWSPDGTRIAFSGERSGKVSVRQKVIDGTAADEALLEGSNNLPFPSGWSPDGRFIALSFTESFPIRSNVWLLPLSGDRKPFPLAQTRFIEGSGVFSPDGRWIAYMSDESGQPNVYVQPFPASGAKYPVSRGGGGQPGWRADGRELFYLGADGTLMAVPIGAGAHFDAGMPQPLFATNVPGNLFYTSQVYAMTRDGKRFLLPARPAQARPVPVTVVVNWLEELKRLVPMK